MANIVFNIAKGRVAELVNRVKANDPATSALILVPLETSGLEADSVLVDKATLADVLAGATNEQTTMGRKVLTDAEIAATTVDTTNDRAECSLPGVTWTAATGNAISKIAVCYDSDTTSGTDASIIPMTMFDYVATPTGIDLQIGAGVFFRAS